MQSIDYIIVDDLNNLMLNAKVETFSSIFFWFKQRRRINLLSLEAGVVLGVQQAFD
jgi:hypothetical protein